MSVNAQQTDTSSGTWAASGSLTNSTSKSQLASVWSYVNGQPFVVRAGDSSNSSDTASFTETVTASDGWNGDTLRNLLSHQE